MGQDKLLWVAWQQFCPDSEGQVKTSSIQDALAARGMTVADLPAEFLEALTKESNTVGFLTFDRFKELLLADTSGQVVRSLSGDQNRGGKFLRWLLPRFNNPDTSVG